MRLVFVGLTMLLIFGCGRETKVIEYVPAPGGGSGNPGSGSGDGTPGDPGSPGNPGNTQISYGEMQAFLDNYCASCHSSSPFIQSERALRGSDTRNQLWSKRMPPSNASKQLPEEERQLMLSFF